MLKAVSGGWVGVRKTIINHWRFHDGVTAVNPGNTLGEIVPSRSWTCWAYPEDHQEFEKWMTQNCPTTDCTLRFNSGDPMYTVYITDDKEATLFQLKYL
jgi:hypothetical protein